MNVRGVKQGSSVAALKQEWKRKIVAGTAEPGSQRVGECDLAAEYDKVCVHEGKFVRPQD